MINSTTAKKAKNDDMVYVRVPYVGRIHELGVYGPFQSLVSKANVIMLIRAGYDVDILNKKKFPEFAEQLEKFNLAKKQNDVNKIVEARKNMVPGGIAPIVQDIVKNSAAGAFSAPTGVTAPVLPASEVHAADKPVYKPAPPPLDENGEILLVPRTN